MRRPYIATANIPETLWRKPDKLKSDTSQGTLRLPSILAQVYREVLEDLGLLPAALNSAPNDDGPQGGCSPRETREHFSRNYGGSCARMQLLALDPTDAFHTTRDIFVQLFSGGSLHLLDLPCGAGAASATLLCLAAELRQQKQLPRCPLRVTILGGDLSKPALQIQRRVYRKLIPRLREYGIMAKAEARTWDIGDAEQTTAFVTEWARLRPSGATSGVLAANFSGFLGDKVKECRDQLRELLRHAGIQQANFYWVEPCTHQALTKLFPGLIKHVYPEVPRMTSHFGAAPRRAECRVAHPIQMDGVFTTRTAAMHLAPKGHAA